MNSILVTNRHDWLACIARLSLGVTIFPHGAQKLFGWFGGSRYTASMNYLTQQAQIPYIIALTFILIEFFGALFLIFGLLTRPGAIGFAGIYIGAIVKVHAANGFFMNWNAEAGKGEGWEYFILLFGLILIAIIAGGGRLSIDSKLTSKTKQNGKQFR